MRLSSRLLLALVALLAAARASAELPAEDDPLPFAEIAAPKTDHDASVETSPLRPYGPYATVGKFGDPALIEFRGLSQVHVEEVRCALRWDPKFQAAARPSSSTDDFLTILESRLLDGFQSSGFPDAKVKATFDVAAERFLVTVTEGHRFRQGKVVVEGDERVDAKQLAAWLTQHQKPRRWTIRYADSAPSAPLEEEGVTLWKPGESLNSTPRVRATLEAGVRWALFEQGFPYASFELNFVPAAEPGLSDLHVQLAHAGSPSTIKEINVEGLSRDTQQQLLDYLDIAPGQRLDPGLLDRTQEKLANSCRYWSHELEVHCGPKPDGRYVPADESVNLKFTLEEFSPMPPLGEPLPEVDEVLRKTAAWINSYPKTGSPDLVIEKVLMQKSAAKDQIRVLPSAAAADGRVAVSFTGSSEYWSFNHTVFLSPQGLEVVDFGARQKCAISWPNLDEAGPEGHGVSKRRRFLRSASACNLECCDR